MLRPWSGRRAMQLLLGGGLALLCINCGDSLRPSGFMLRPIKAFLVSPPDVQEHSLNWTAMEIQDDDGLVEFRISGAPSDLSVTAERPIEPALGVAIRDVLRVEAQADTAGGIETVVIRGTYGGINDSFHLPIVIAPDPGPGTFELLVEPTSVRLQPGASGIFEYALFAGTRYRGEVQVRVEDVDEPFELVVGAVGTHGGPVATHELNTINTGFDLYRQVATGEFRIDRALQATRQATTTATVVATDGLTERRVAIELIEESDPSTLPRFEIELSPTALEYERSSTIEQVAFTVRPLNGFVGTVDIGTDNVPRNFRQLTTDPEAVVINADTQAVSGVMDIYWGGETLGPEEPPGPLVMDVTGTSGELTAFANLTLLRP